MIIRDLYPIKIYVNSLIQTPPFIKHDTSQYYDKGKNMSVRFYLFLVNVVLDKRLVGKTNMGAAPKTPEWSAAKAVDGNTDQNYTSNSCALTNYYNRNTSIWWKVWLQRQFNIAYLEIYFRSDSKLLLFVSKKDKIYV